MLRAISVSLLLIVSQVALADIYTAKLECYSAGNIRLHLLGDSESRRVFMTSQWTEPETKENTDWRRGDEESYDLRGTDYQDGILSVSLENNHSYYSPKSFEVHLKNFRGTKTCQILSGTLERSGHVQAPTYLGDEKVTCAIRIRSEDEDRLANRNSESPEPACSLPAQYRVVKFDEGNNPLEQIPVGTKLVTSGVRSDYVSTLRDSAGNEVGSQADDTVSEFDLKALGVMDHRSEYVNDSNRFLPEIGCTVILPKSVSLSAVGLPKTSTVTEVDEKGNLILDNGSVLSCENYEIDTSYLYPLEGKGKPQLEPDGPFTVKVLRRVLAKNKIQLLLAPVPANKPVQKIQDDGQE